MFFWELNKIFNNTFLDRTAMAAAYEFSKNFWILDWASFLKYFFGTLSKWIQ